MDSFYSLVSQQNFSAAAQLWTPQMRAAYPPAQYIDDRFRGATITVLSARVITQSTDSATVAVDLQQTGGTQPGEIIGTWNLVKSPSGWLLAQPDLHYAAPPEAPTPAAVLKSGHAAVPPPHGRGHGKGPKGPHGHKP